MSCLLQFPLKQTERLAPVKPALLLSQRLGEKQDIAKFIRM
jgi:hypothetical protein